jgi:hypothetical protein
VQGHDLAVVSLLKATTGMPGEQQAVLLHQSIDALVVDRTSSRPLSFQERGDPAVAIGRSYVDHAADLRSKLQIPIPDLRPSLGPHALEALDDVGAGHAERVGDSLHRKPSLSTELDRQVAFFDRLSSIASLRISISPSRPPGRACDADRIEHLLMLDRLLAKQPLQITHPLLEPACFGGWNNLVIRTDRLAPAFAHQPPPPEHHAR